MTEPIYLTDQSVETIVVRMNEKFVAIDVSEGSVMEDFVRTTAVELQDVGVRAQLLHQQSYLSGATGANLDARADERNLSRNAALAATVDVTFTGVAGTAIPLGTRVSTVGTPDAPAVAFATTIAAVIGAGSPGAVAIPCAALVPGRGGNVGPSTIDVVLDYVSGVADVDNALAAGGGTDAESDASLRARVLYDVRTISAGGNVGDYVRWSMDVDGVGGVTVVPQGSGPGTVDLYVVSNEGLVPSADVVADVQDYIAPQYAFALEAEDQTIFGRTGAVAQVDRSDDTGESVVLSYQAGTAQRVEAILEATSPVAVHRLPRSAAGLKNPGVWRSYTRVLAGQAVGTGALVEIGIWNQTRNDWARTTQSGSVLAMLMRTGAGMPTAFTEMALDFFWDGTDEIRHRVTRMLSDTTPATTVVVDRVRYVSSFSSDQVDVYGKAPIGARVTVYPAPTVTVTVVATIHVLPGYDKLVVVPAVQARLGAYLQLLALDPTDKTVRYIPLGAVMFEVDGVEFVTGYTLNGAMVDLVMPLGGIGVMGSTAGVAAAP